MIRCHKIRIYPNRAQEEYFCKCLGIARLSYNWMLAEWAKEYLAGGKPSELSLRRKFNAIKCKEFPFIAEVSKCVPQNAQMNLGKAFQNFFKKKARHPQFKSKRHLDTSIRMDDGAPYAMPKVNHKHIRFAKTKTWVKMAETPRFKGKLISSTLSRRAGQWFVSLAFESETPEKTVKIHRNCGVDLGCKDLATLSIDGDIEKTQGPKALKNTLGKLRRYSRRLSKKNPGSRNREKAKTKLARLHLRIANVRMDATHKLTSRLAKTCENVVIEDLNVKGMLRLRSLARSVSDQSFGEFRRQLDYKCKLYGSNLIVVDRFYPSSKMCSICGNVYANLMLSMRKWKCPKCGTVHDRDANAARNLEMMVGRVSPDPKACGVGSSGLRGVTRVKLPTKKQESLSLISLE